MSTYNQGNPSVSQVISASNVFVYGNTSSGNALSVQQLGAGNVATFRTQTGASALFVGANGNVGVGTGNPAANFHVYGASPYRVVTDSSGATDAKSWWESYSGGNAVFYCANDANNASAQWMVVNRSGYTPQYISWLTGGAERMRIDSSGRVGIGTASPTQLLDISGGANTALRIRSSAVGGTRNVGISLENSNSTTPSGIYMDGADRMAFYTFGGHRMSIDYNGNVGIGTTNPAYALDVVGAARVNTGTSNVIIGGGQGAGQGGLYILPTSSISGASWKIGCGLQGSYSNAISFDSGCNVGIGTTSPVRNLVAYNSAASESNAAIISSGEGINAALYLGTPRDGSATSALKAAIIAEAQTNWSRSKMHFCLDNTTDNGLAYTASVANARMTIQPDGKVGIGTTSPSYPLYVNGFVTSPSLATRYFNYATALTQANQTTNLSIYASNDIGAGNNIVSFSDKRAKVLEEPPSESYMNLVDKIQVHQYSWVDKIEKGSSKKIGFFAQEVEEVVPDAVGQTTAVIPTIYREADAFTATTLTVTGHGLTTEKKLEVVDPENGKTKIDILRVIDADTLEVKFEKVPKEKLFVVGPEVDDSRMVNHDYLMAVGFGGLKELHALVKTQQTTIEMLTERLAALEGTIGSRLGA